MIIRLQATLGNRWAAIATYLPQRTDNDIKNYWNTHLKKKIKKLQSGIETQSNPVVLNSCQLIFRTNWEKKSQNLVNAQYPSHQSSTYASSTENISRLLEGWMRSSPKAQKIEATNEQKPLIFNIRATDSGKHNRVNDENGKSDMISHEDLESLLSFDSTVLYESPQATISEELKDAMEISAQPPLSLLEKWLMDEATVQGEGELVEMSDEVF
ncbi:hypothetical protein AMTR_s00119p00069270 [Amborella trichopoda]|uniref:Uncharacterized protein n=1 Tax=Amborella trichopoda TaxID=13333 RepID=W1NNE8_AMBTC|nr:hypothetical protein AMTR_s00119p00069270 [Amborella trichopoda]